jgi:hypothetical protein
LTPLNGAAGSGDIAFIEYVPVRIRRLISTPFSTSLVHTVPCGPNSESFAMAMASASS